MLLDFCLSVFLLLSLFFLYLQCCCPGLRGQRQIWSVQAGIYTPGLPPGLCKGHSDRVTLPVRQLTGRKEGRRVCSDCSSPRKPGSAARIIRRGKCPCLLLCGPSSTRGLAALSSSGQHQLHPEEATPVPAAHVGVHPLPNRGQH